MLNCSIHPARLRELRREAKDDPRTLNEHWYVLFAERIEAELKKTGKLPKPLEGSVTPLPKPHAYSVDYQHGPSADYTITMRFASKLDCAVWERHLRSQRA